MRPLADIEKALTTMDVAADPGAAAVEFLQLSEEVLEHWLAVHGREPTDEKREGFRLLALHRLGTKGDPSFNACRETCREIAFHYNLVTMQPEHAEITHRAEMLRMVSNHLYLFVSGKLQVAGLGEFCCSAKPIRSADKFDSGISKEA
jgi:hypothetical protein